MAGWKGYTTNLVSQPATFVIEAYHQLWRIEKAFRMSSTTCKPADLSPHPRLHRSPPQRCLRRDGGIALDRAPNRLEH
ncbi:putative transposase [Mycobacterium avium MAV_120709_2344]|nr:putative transposase [Mycobacterium avium MAV_120709_2344]